MTPRDAALRRAAPRRAASVPLVVGFVRAHASERSYFFHLSEVVDGVTDLRTGDEVSFALSVSARTKERNATAVQRTAMVRALLLRAPLRTAAPRAPLRTAAPRARARAHGAASFTRVRARALTRHARLYATSLLSSRLPSRLCAAISLCLARAPLQAPPAAAASKLPPLPVRKSTEVGAGVIRQAKGPDGTRGFARFRARLAPPAEDELQAGAPAEAAAD